MMLRLYVADVSELPVSAAGLSLSDYRREKLSKTDDSRAFKLGLGAELLLLRALEDCEVEHSVPLAIKREGQGKPYIDALGVDFSLSHSGTKVMCAISDKPVGADIQILGPCRDAVVRRKLSQSEQYYVLNSDDRASAFTLIWALKESWLKMTGQGIAAGIDTVSVYPERDYYSVKGMDCGFFHASLENYKLALCLKGSPIPHNFTFNTIKLA